MLIGLAGFVSLIAVVVAYYAWRIEPYRLVFRKRVIEIRGLDPLAGAISVLHISDLHMRDGEQRKAAMLASLFDLHPDLVVITGDFVQTTGDVQFCGEALRGLKAKYGKIGVLGNHDHYRYGWRTVFRRTARRPAARPSAANSPQDIRVALEDAGVSILANSHVRLNVHGQDIWVIGVDDPYNHLADLPEALKGVPLGAVKLLLAHSPDIIDQASKAEIELVLCGHTHGGQVLLPVVGALVTRTRKPLERPAGVISRNGTLTHISPGIGGGTLTLRFCCPPEATLLELRPPTK